MPHRRTKPTVLPLAPPQWAIQESAWDQSSPLVVFVCFLFFYCFFVCKCGPADWDSRWPTSDRRRRRNGCCCRHVFHMARFGEPTHLCGPSRPDCVSVWRLCITNQQETHKVKLCTQVREKACSFTWEWNSESFSGVSFSQTTQQQKEKRSPQPCVLLNNAKTPQ